MLYREISGNKHANKPVLQLSSKRWESLLYHNWDRLVDELCRSLVALQEKANAMDIVPRYFYIHYLRTSVNNELPFFRLDLFDEKKWNGNTECWVYWDASIVTGMLYACLPIVVDEYAIRPDKNEAEIEQKRLACADVLYNMIKQMIESIFQEAVCKAGFDTRHITAFYGEYVGEAKKMQVI